MKSSFALGFLWTLAAASAPAALLAQYPYSAGAQRYPLHAQANHTRQAFRGDHGPPPADEVLPAPYAAQYPAAPQHTLAPQPMAMPQQDAGGYGPCNNGAAPGYGNGYYEGQGAAQYEGYGAAGGEAYCDGYGAGGMGGAMLGEASMWFGGVGALFMTRDNENKVWFSYGDAAEDVQLLNSREAAMDWQWGWEGRFGRYFACGQSGVEAVYWGLSSGSEEANLWAADVAGSLNTTLNIGGLNYDDGLGGGPTGIAWWFNDAVRHRLIRSYETHNIEVNFLSLPFQCCGDVACCRGNMLAPQRPCRFTLLGGFRYFRFRETLNFATDNGDGVFNWDADELYYDIKVENNLFGFQIGGQADYEIICGLRATAGLKIGAFLNHVNHCSRIEGENGTPWVGAGPNAGMDFDVKSNKNDLAFLAQLDLGLSYQITNCWSVGAGYRAVAVTGVGLSTNQIPWDFRGIQDVADVDTNGSLILHGAYVNLEYNY